MSDARLAGVPSSMAEVVGQSGEAAAMAAAAAKLREKKMQAEVAAAERQRKREAENAAKALEAVAKAKAAEDEAKRIQEENADAEFTFLCLKEMYPDADVKAPRSGSSAKAFQAAIKQYEVYEMMKKKPEQLHFAIGSALLGYETMCETTQNDLLNIYAKGLGATFRDNPTMKDRMRPHYQRLIMAYPKWFRMGLPPIVEFAIALTGEIKNLSTVLREQQKAQGRFARPEGPDEFDEDEEDEGFDRQEFEDL